MKLAVDTHHLRQEHAGTRRVTVNLLEQFRKMPGIELTELSPGYSLSRGSHAAGKVLSHFFRFFWVHIHLPLKCLRHKADVLLSPEFNTPLFTHCKKSVIVHDAHIRAQKEFVSPLWFYLYYIPFIEFAIRRADVILTISEFSKREIVDLMRLDERKVHVVYHGLDPRFSAAVAGNPGLLKKYGLIEKEYILFVGTFEARKNIERLVQAFGLFKQAKRGAPQNMKLAIAGKASTGKHSDRSLQVKALISDLGLQDDVVLCGFVPDDDLPALYRASAMVAFLSLYEGFGFPVIEGFASGVPVLASDLCSVPEIAGDAALLADPYSVKQVAEKMLMILSDKDLSNHLIALGLNRAGKFSWKSSASLILSRLRAL